MRFEHNRIKSIRKWQVPDLNFVGITPNGTTVVAVTDSCVTFLDCESSQETNVPRELPTETDFRVVTSTNDQGMISYGLGNWTARVYRAKATGLTQTYLWRAGSFVRGASLSDDGQLCAFGSRQGIVTVVDLQRIEQTRQLESHTSRVDLVALSADLSTAYSRTQDGTLLTWELSGGTCLGTQKGQQNFAGLQKPDAPPLILSGYDNQGARLVRTAGVHPGNPSAGCPAARLADPALLVTGGWDRAVRLWDVPSGRCLAVYPFDSRVSALAVSPRPPHIAVVGLWSGEVHFLDIQGI
jgi:WD40 repeat protein